MLNQPAPTESNPDDLCGFILSVLVYKIEGKLLVESCPETRHPTRVQ